MLNYFELMLSSLPRFDGSTMTNQLYYGDNLGILRSFKDETVDLIYLDPPFNSNATYNVLFRAPDTGEQSHAQIEAFEDTWHWGIEAERAFDEVMKSGCTTAADMLNAMRGFLGENDMMAYLAMMTVRMLEMRRVLKPTGTVFLHCDPTASHYLKILLDAVFGPARYLNEIIWRRTGAHSPRKSFGPIHDVIHAYTKSPPPDYKFNIVRRPYMKGHVESRYKPAANGKMKFTSGGNVLTGAGATGGPGGQAWRGFDPTSKGRHWAIPSFYEELMPESYKALNSVEKLEALYQAKLVEIEPGTAWPIMVRYLDERDGTPLTDIWAYQPYTQGTVWGTAEGIDEDVAWLGPTDPERLGYPTQKPIGLLARIIQSVTEENDVVLDPFCGGGTTMHAAQRLKRQWIGIDITHLAISLAEKRLKDAFPGIEYEVHGTPKDLEGAHALAEFDKYQFQWWAVSLVDAQPYGGKKKGADTGIDGVIYCRTGAKKTERVIVSVKGGKSVGVGMVRDLRAVIEREKSPIGILISLAPPTKDMVTEAAKAGFVETEYGKFERLQILTVEELFGGKRARLPVVDTSAAFKKAAKEDMTEQHTLEL